MGGTLKKKRLYCTDIDYSYFDTVSCTISYLTGQKPAIKIHKSICLFSCFSSICVLCCLTTFFTFPGKLIL